MGEGASGVVAKRVPNRAEMKLLGFCLLFWTLFAVAEAEQVGEFLQEGIPSKEVASKDTTALFEPEPPITMKAMLDHPDVWASYNVPSTQRAEAPSWLLHSSRHHDKKCEQRGGLPRRKQGKNASR